MTTQSNLICESHNSHLFVSTLTLCRREHLRRKGEHFVALGLRKSSMRRDSQHCLCSATCSVSTVANLLSWSHFWATSFGATTVTHPGGRRLEAKCRMNLDASGATGCTIRSRTLSCLGFAINYAVIRKGLDTMAISLPLFLVYYAERMNSSL